MHGHHQDITKVDLLLTEPSQVIERVQGRVSIFFRGRKWATSVIIKPMLSFGSIFPFHLLVGTVQFGLLSWTNFEASFYRPATFGAKICGIGEMKTAIQTACCNSRAPDLFSAIDSDCIFCRPATFGAKIYGIRELKTTI
jgi:hypothetical protein